MKGTLLDSEPAVNNYPKKIEEVGNPLVAEHWTQHCRVAELWERAGGKLFIFTLGNTESKKIIATRGPYKLAHLKEAKHNDWFGVAPCGDMGIIDVDMHGTDDGFNLLARLEKDLGMMPGELKEGAYSITPGKGRHIAVKFPPGMLDGQKFNKKIYGDDHPELEFFHGDKFKCILPGAVRYDGWYRFTKEGREVFDRGELRCVELTKGQAEAFIQTVQGKETEAKGPKRKKTLPSWTDPENWKKGNREKMFKRWVIRLWPDKENVDGLIRIAMDAWRKTGEDEEGEKKIQGLCEWAKKIKDVRDEDIFSIKAGETITVSHDTANGVLKGADGEILFYVLEELLHTEIRFNTRTDHLEARFMDQDYENDYTSWKRVSNADFASLVTLARDKVWVEYKTDKDGDPLAEKYRSRTEKAITISMEGAIRARRKVQG